MAFCDPFLNFKVMKWYILFNGFKPQRKCDPFTGASLAASVAPAAINTVGNLFSSLFGQSSQASENQKNRDWQERMWRMNNEYNTPLAQRKRMEEAGYNPYLLGDDASASGQSSQPNAPAISPLPQFHNPVDGSMQLLQQGLQVESNVELQRMKSLETISDVMLKLYKDGGQKQVDDFMREFVPTLKSLSFEGSFFEQKLKKEFLSMDIANDRADLERSLRQKFGDKEMQTKLNFIDKEISKMSAEISKMSSEKALNYKRVEELGSEMARNFAQAGLFSAQSSQITVLLPYIRSVMENNAMTSEMDYQDREAYFLNDESLRKYLKTNYAKGERKWQYSSEHNPVFDFLRGFTKSVPVSPLGIGGSVGTKYYGREGLNGFMKYDYLPFGQ